MKRRFFSTSELPRSPTRRTTTAGFFILLLSTSLLLLTIIACGESEEDRLRNELVAIYADNIEVRVNEELRNNGYSHASDDDYRDACDMWDDFDYRPMPASNDEEGWREVVERTREWMADNDASEREHERMANVWIWTATVTGVLQREMDTIFDGEDFCEFKSKS